MLWGLILSILVPIAYAHIIIIHSMALKKIEGWETQWSNWKIGCVHHNWFLINISCSWNRFIDVNHGIVLICKLDLSGSWPSIIIHHNLYYSTMIHNQNGKRMMKTSFKFKMCLYHVLNNISHIICTMCTTAMTQTLKVWYIYSCKIRKMRRMGYLS